MKQEEEKDTRRQTEDEMDLLDKFTIRSISIRLSREKKTCIFILLELSPMNIEEKILDTKYSIMKIQFVLITERICSIMLVYSFVSRKLCELMREYSTQYSFPTYSIELFAVDYRRMITPFHF